MNENLLDFIRSPIKEGRLYIQYAYLRIKRFIVYLYNRKTINKYRAKLNVLLVSYTPLHELLLRAGFIRADQLLIEVNYHNKLILLQQSGAEIVLEFSHIDAYWKDYDRQERS